MSNLSLNGYQVIERLIDRQTIGLLDRAIDSAIESESTYGIRELHHKIPLVNKIANSQLLLNVLRQQTNYTQFRLIKAIYFDKSIRHNWSVPWHQDKTIAVQNKALLPGFKNWTIKQGVIHVQPPLEVLKTITTIRIALDNTNASNGGLKIISRSHNLGILTQAKINSICEQRSQISLAMTAGDALIMHPLILHSSNKSLKDNHRRIIHLEYSSGNLPPELAWH